VKSAFFGPREQTLVDMIGKRNQNKKKEEGYGTTVRSISHVYRPFLPQTFFWCRFLES